MKKNLSRQNNILHFIYQYVEQKGYPPTVREIGEAVFLSSTSTVHGYLSRLEKNGFIKRDPSKPRAIEITKKGHTCLGIFPKGLPVLGALGDEITCLSEHSEIEYFPYFPYLPAQRNDLYLLKVNDDSLTHAGIFNQDYIVILKQKTAENGELILLETPQNTLACRRFFKEKTAYRLQTEDEKLETLFVKQLTILGKIISVYRPFVQ